MILMTYKRKQLKLTQTQLAYLTNMSMTDISKIECGWSIPYKKQAEKLAHILNIPVERLLEEVSNDKM